MSKSIIAALVGGIILFVWQFLSWAILPVHKADAQYTPNQDQIIACLSQNLTAEGTYMVPNSPPGTSHDQAEKDMEKYMGKPWATVSYHPAMTMNMGMNMARGIAVDFIAVFLLVWLLGRFARLDMSSAVTTSVTIGIISYLTFPYLNSIWMEVRSLGHLVDAIVPWALIGGWLGWFLNRR
jgi:hypothetical protein